MTLVRDLRLALDERGILNNPTGLAIYRWEMGVPAKRALAACLGSKAMPREFAGIPIVFVQDDGWDLVEIASSPDVIPTGLRCGPSSISKQLDIFTGLNAPGAVAG